VRGWRSLLALLALLAPGVAHAEGGEHGPMALVWHALNLALLVGIIVYLARKPLFGYLHERRQTIEEGIESARAELARAEQRLAEWKQRVGTLDAELAEIRRAVLEQAEAERARILADAEAAAERIGRDAVAAVDQELRVARERLRAEAAELAVRLAAEQLERTATDADRERLVDEFVHRVEAASSRRPN
jgi:F-type H+-transporting ATPase subunit b